jgi:hypothetical protein
MLSERSVRDHADWREAIRQMERLAAQRDQLNLKRNRLRDELADLKQSLATQRSPAPDSSPLPQYKGRRWLEYDENGKKSLGSSDRLDLQRKELRDAQEDKRKADEERKQVQKDAKGKQ